MAIRRNPLYVFKNLASVGIFEVPLDSIIQLVDSDGAGTPSMTLFIDKRLLNITTTMAQYIATPTAYIELDRYSEILNDLDDVELTSIQDKDIMVYDSLNNIWVNAPAGATAGNIKLGDLADVPTPAPSNDGNQLVWDNANNRWEYTVSVEFLNDLADVNTTPVADHVLMHDGTGWKSTNVIDGGSF